MKPRLSDNPLLALGETMGTMFAFEFLRALGWRCEEPESAGEEFEVGELARLLDRKPSFIMVRLHHRDCPPTRRRLGPKGRLLSLVVTAELEAWLTRPSQPGKKLRPTP